MTNAEEIENDAELEETNDDDYGPEVDEEESSEETEGEDRVSSESDRDKGERTHRRDSQIERLKREKAELQAKLAERSGETGDAKANTNTALIERTYLAANGYKDKEVQAEILRLAKKFDLSVDEALEDADIKRRADALLTERKAARSVAPGTGGTRQTTRDVDYWTKRLADKGEQAPTAEMRAQVLKKLAGK
jgi:hypothetical protein